MQKSPHGAVAEESSAPKQKWPTRKHPPVLEPGHTFASVTDKIAALVLYKKTPLGWFVGFSISFMFLMVLLFTMTMLFLKGTGLWGLNIPVGWAFDIVNFVWWVG